MGVISRIWHWYQFKASIPQNRLEERESREEELKIRRRISFALPIHDPADRELLIEAAQTAAVGVFLPAWMNRRHSRLAIIGAGIVTAGSATLLLWLLNDGAILDSFIKLTAPKGSGLSLLSQAEVLIISTAAGALWVGRRAVVAILRDRLHPSPESERSGYDIFLILCATAIGIAVVGLPWVAFFASNHYQEWPIGWQVLLGGGLVLGVALPRWANALRNFLVRHARTEYEESIDQVVWQLHYLAWTLHVNKPRYLKPRLLREIRTHIGETARIIEINPIPLRTTHWRERTLRRQIRQDHARIAAVLRGFSKDIATLHSLDQYDRVCAAVLAGAISAAHGNWDELLENAPEVTLISRSARSLRKATPALTLAGAALTIPALPGVGPASDGIRVLLLATAVLSILPASDTTREIVRGTLDKALLKDPGAGASKSS